MCSNLIYRARIAGYTCNRWTADALKRPFYSLELSDSNWLITKIAKMILMGLSVGTSLVPRFLANILNPHDYCHTEGDAHAIDVAGEIDVLSMNILGFHAQQASGENRPFWQDRFELFCQAIEEANADVVCLQEVHSGSWLENKLIERFKGKYSDFYGDIAPKMLMFGSGLFIMHRIKGATLDVQKYTDSTGNDSKFVNKAFAVLKTKDFAVINTHMQSGNAREDEEFRKTRWKQTEQVVDYARELGTKTNILCGDLNEDRTDCASYKPSMLNPDNGHVMDGFATDAKRKAFTQADLNKDGSIGGQEAVDNIVAIRSEKEGDAGCTLSTKQWTEFQSPRQTPTDHAAMLAKIKFKATAAT